MGSLRCACLWLNDLDSTEAWALSAFERVAIRAKESGRRFGAVNAFLRH
jgi:hypothetical protein